jgi:tetratricopeptide (TPR) repeat protein
MLSTPIQLLQHATRAHQQNRLDEAAAGYSRVIESDPANVGAYVNLGMVLRQQKKFAAARLAYARAIHLAPQDASIFSNYGNLLADMKRFDEAAAMQARALALDPDNVGYLYNAGVVPFHNNQPRQAIEYFSKVLAVQPDHRDARWNRSLAYLQQGDYLAGFKEYECRFDRQPTVPHRYSQPRWAGEDIHDQVLLLTTEQGFGDVIQFARFIPLVAQRTKAVKVVCRKELVRLVKTVDGVAEVIVKGSKLPAFDWYAPLLSLPHILQYNVQNLPNAVPYFHVLPAVTMAFPGGSRPGLKVGLMWAGKLTPVDRSCPLELFIPLLQHADVNFYSFQLADRQKDINKLGCDAFIHDLSGSIRDFADTAALLQQMDLVITIDSAVAHLCGALGVPTWVLLLHASDWRWLLARSDSPWYPAMRLFRQGSHGDWQGCLESVYKEAGDLFSG